MSPNWSPILRAELIAKPTEERDHTHALRRFFVHDHPCATSSAFIFTGRQQRVRSPHHHQCLRTTSRIVAVSPSSRLSRTAPRSDQSGTDKASRHGNGVPFTEGPRARRGNRSPRPHVGRESAPVQATHVYPILGVAQYLAVQQAQAAIPGGGRERLEADRGAVAGASFVTMSYLFPTPANVQAFQDLLTAQANAGPGQPHPAFAAGEAIGRAVGAQIVARAIADHFRIRTPRPPRNGGRVLTPNVPGQRSPVDASGNHALASDFRPAQASPLPRVHSRISTPGSPDRHIRTRVRQSRYISPPSGH